MSLEFGIIWSLEYRLKRSFFMFKLLFFFFFIKLGVKATEAVREIFEEALLYNAFRTAQNRYELFKFDEEPLN